MRWQLLAIPLLAVLLGGPASALPLRATFTGTGTGSLGAQAFSDTLVIVTVIADTDDAGPEPIPLPVFSVVAGQVSLIVNGIGTVVFSDATQLFVNQNGNVGIRTLLAPLVPDYLNLDCDIDCSSWDLTTSFGTLSDPTPGGMFANVATNAGTLDFTSLGPFTFDSIVAPEPSTALLLCSGLIALARIRR